MASQEIKQQAEAISYFILIVYSVSRLFSRLF